MTRSIVTIPLLLSLAPPVRAQQGVPAPNAPNKIPALAQPRGRGGGGACFD